MHPSIPMHEMSKLEFLLNNPEWVAVFASAVFAVFTITVIIWQVFVMKEQVRVMVWQGRTSARHESRQNRLIESQNRLIRFQFEHERIQILNGERARLLKLGRKLQLSVSCLKETPSEHDGIFWDEVVDEASELNVRLSTLDIDAYDDFYGEWYFHLTDYVESLLRAIADDGKQPAIAPGIRPAPTTVAALLAIEKRCDPTQIFLEIETAIRMDFFDFKNRWDAETSNV
jgi:hypothetical protein